jgi:hypothetical protein
LKISTFHSVLKNRNFNFFLESIRAKIKNFNPHSSHKTRTFQSSPQTGRLKFENFNFSLCASKLKITTFHSALKSKIYLTPVPKNSNFSSCPLKIVISSFSSNLNERKSKISSVHLCRTCVGTLKLSYYALVKFNKL